MVKLFQTNWVAVLNVETARNKGPGQILKNIFLALEKRVGSPTVL